MILLVPTRLESCSATSRVPGMQLSNRSMRIKSENQISVMGEGWMGERLMEEKVGCLGGKGERLTEHNPS